MAGPRAVAVFGSSDPLEGEPLYALGRQVGHLLASEGFVVVTGGYGGVMEAASRGAVEAGGEAYGVTVRALTALRAAPNRYLTRHVEAEDLFDRTRELIRSSGGYIILPGKAGTLAELTFLWALNRAQLLRSRPIVLLGSSWQSFLEQVAKLEMVDRGEIDITMVARSAEEAVRMIRDGMA